MSVSSNRTISFWRMKSTSGFHINTGESCSSEVTKTIEALASQPLGSKVQFDISSPDQAILKRVDAECSEYISAQVLTIQSAEPGTWDIQETENEITVHIGLPWVAIFARMLSIDGVAFGPVDETSKVHIWC